MRRRILLTVLIVCMLAFIWGNSLLSREISGAISDTILKYANRVAEAAGLGESFFSFFTDTDGDGEAEETSHWIRKAAHITEFAVFAVLLRLRLESTGEKRFFTVLALSGATAAMDETLQIFSHRGSQLRDVLIDLAGALLGLGLVWLLGRKRRKRETA